MLSCTCTVLILANKNWCLAVASLTELCYDTSILISSVAGAQTCNGSSGASRYIVSRGAEAATLPSLLSIRPNKCRTDTLTNLLLISIN
jgi:hypothetical protein